jgi:hypothetical protein
MRQYPHRTITLPRVVLGAVLFLTAAAVANTSYAREVKYFIKSSATTCDDLAQDMDAQNFPNDPMFGPAASFDTQVIVNTLETGDYPAGDPDVSITNIYGNSSFDWEATSLGFTLICVKAGNGRTCYVPEWDQLTQGFNYSDLNTTSNINTVYFCSNAENPPAYGGPDCDYSGESLYDLFNVLGNNHSVLTFFDGKGNSSTCGGPDPETNSAVYSNCSGADAYAPIGDNDDDQSFPLPPRDANGICDPTEETCCRIDNLCAQGYGNNIGQIVANCTLNVGGPTTSTGYSKGGDNTCITYGPSGDGSPVQVCW